MKHWLGTSLGPARKILTEDGFLFTYVMPVLFGCAYMILGELGHFCSIGESQMATFWPPAGFGLATFLSVKTRRWPIYIASLMASNWIFDAIFHDKTFLVTLGFSIGNALETLSSAYLIRRCFGNPFTLSRIREVLFFAVISVLAAPVLSATIGSFVVVMAYEGEVFSKVWPVWWAGDVLGVLVLTPPVLRLFQTRLDEFRERMSLLRLVEAAAMSLLVFGVSLFIFNLSHQIPVSYIAAPLLLWPALRFGVQGVGWMVLLLAAIAARCTADGLGPFVIEGVPLWLQIVLLQVYISINGVMALLLAVAVEEQKKASGSLTIVNEMLETRMVELYQAEERARSVIDHVNEGIVSIDEQGIVQTFNPGAERLFGFKASEVIGENVKILVPEPYKTQHDFFIARYLRTKEGRIIGHGREVMGQRRDGSWFPMDLSINVFKLGYKHYFTAILRDITERKQFEESLREEIDHRRSAEMALLKYQDELEQKVRERTAEIEMANASLERSLNEKVVMLREIHHRVKNNLQIVSTLLDLQSEHIKDPQAVEMFEESRSRVKSMALIHERLYRSGDQIHVEFTPYISQLADDLYRTYHISEDGVALELDVD
ncbi:MAG: MASE1 domain-containing protein, partial [Gemmataceae bacterium]